MAEALNAQKSNQYLVGVRAARVSTSLSANRTIPDLCVWLGIMILANALSGGFSIIFIKGDKAGGQQASQTQF